MASQTNPLSEMIEAACQRAVTSAMELRSRRLMKVPEAADYLALSRREVYNMIANGNVRFVSHGKCKMIDIRDLDSWIEQHKK